MDCVHSQRVEEAARLAVGTTGPGENTRDECDAPWERLWTSDLLRAGEAACGGNLLWMIAVRLSSRRCTPISTPSLTTTISQQIL